MDTLCLTLGARLIRVTNERQQMIANQMEFGIQTKPTTTCSTRRRQRRLPAARWWFEQMHRAVDHSPAGEAERLKRLKQADIAFPGGRN